MSKRLTFFALVAVLVMAFVGSAFAADTQTRTWQGAANADWGVASNWKEGHVPTSLDLASFPNSAAIVNISGKQDVGAILIDSGANVTFNLTNASSLLSIFNQKIDAEDSGGTPITYPVIEAKGNLTISGSGQLELRSGAAIGRPDYANLAAPAKAFFDVAEAAKVDIGVVISADQGIANLQELVKVGKGTLEFSAVGDNKFDAAIASFDVVDGEVAIGRSGHLGTDPDNKVYLDTKGVQGRSVTLTTTWTDKDAFVDEEKINVITDATLNVREEGSTLELKTADGVVTINATKTLTKAGAGDLLLSRADVLAETASPASLNIAAGDVIVGVTGAISGDRQINVAVGAESTFKFNNNVSDDIRNLSGTGTLSLLEGSVAVLNGPGTSFPGKITGTGSIRIGDPVMTAVAKISGTANDYTGDTFVGMGSKLIINHERNLGVVGNLKSGKIYLDPLNNLANSANTTSDGETFATLEVAEDCNFTIAKELFIGDPLVAGNNENTGGALIFVPNGSRLTVGNNLTYNRNVLVKSGLGELILDSVGNNSTGSGQFEVGSTGNNVTTALHIINGRVSIENRLATATGDIVVDGSTSTSVNPILSIRNGIKTTSSVLFTQGSTLMTDLVDRNIGSGTDIPAAAEVGYVYYQDVFTPGNPTGSDINNQMYVRPTFGELGGTIKKGDRFQILKSTNIFRLTANNIIKSVEFEEKAPYDPYVSQFYVYFDATMTIDVPVFGTPSVTTIAPDAAFSFTIPVTTESGLKAGSASVFTSPAIDNVAATIDGDVIRITGTAPADGQVTFTVNISSNGDTYTDILGYDSRREFTLTVSGSTPEIPSSNVPAPTIDKAAGTIGATAFKYTVAGDPVINETLKFVLTDVNYVSDARGSFVNGVYELTDITGTDGKASVTFTGIGEGEYTLAVFDASGAQIGTTRAINDFKPTDPEVPTSSGSSGCDAGFGAFALLALGAAVVLRKKD